MASKSIPQDQVKAKAALDAVAGVIRKRVEVAQKAVRETAKAEDMRICTSAMSDLQTLERVAKRLEKGFYAE